MKENTKGNDYPNVKFIYNLFSTKFKYFNIYYVKTSYFQHILCKI